jgi:hypothetical protein
MNQLKIVYLPIGELKPYKKNTRKHQQNDVDNIALSIQKYGMNDAIGIWGEDNVIVEGHGRLLACKKLGMTEVPCVRLDHMTDEQRREYAIAHNATAELSEWDFAVLSEELTDLDLGDFDFDFEIEEDEEDDFDQKTNDEYYEKMKKEFQDRIEAGEIDEGDEEYQAFLEKFEPKKTTDDCYTPELVYQAVLNWCKNEYGIKEQKIVRPFYPGGDYRAFRYLQDCVVVDNPPFSIISEICRYYCENNVRFFLFAPALTLFCIRNGCKISVGATITYENGAVVPTSFVTNLENHEARSAPDLYQEIKKANEQNVRERKKELPKYSYPLHLLTASDLAKFSKYGQLFALQKKSCVRVSELDSQKESGKAIYGGGYLISEKAAAEKAAAEKAAAEKAAAEKWTLSTREMEIISELT